MSEGLRIETLRPGHAIAGFDCGKEALNRYLTRYAWQNQQAGASRTYVALDDEHVVGFYTLAVGHIAFDDAAERLKKGLARHPVPVMLLARLAVGIDRQGQRLGAGLLKDAMLRTLQAAEIAGIRAFVVHAKDDNARAFYERHDFLPSPTDPFHMFVLLKDVRALID
ncbi:GCN5 family acetyltransferase [Sphingomonas panacis]|uniref:GCN5 family acetyltransferase n=1 Tax=Sphingomonas panacis TaxID=1560345 RepID=A0A1B3ZAL1_9SPHN|nr:GCN5 family acetyltransferase [Sphingomonas panacis]